MNPNPPIRSQRAMREGCQRARIFAIAILILAGCSAESELTRLDPSLTDRDLRQGKLAVLGVVKYQEPDQVRPPLIAMLEKTWREERADVPLVPAESVSRALGLERDRKLLLSYEYQGKLDPAALAEISDSLRGVARYLVVARVDKDRIRNSTRGVSSSDTTVVRPDYAIGVTGRDAGVAVQLYDLERRALVMSARFEGSTENERPMLSPLRSRGNDGVTLEVKGVSPEEMGYPGEPDLAPALEEPFRNFARMLPGSPKPPSTPPDVKK
jgi:hypothetical protein